MQQASWCFTAHARAPYMPDTCTALCAPVMKREHRFSMTIPSEAAKNASTYLMKCRSASAPRHKHGAYNSVAPPAPGHAHRAAGAFQLPERMRHTRHLPAGEKRLRPPPQQSSGSFPTTCQAAPVRHVCCQVHLLCRPEAGYSLLVHIPDVRVPASQAGGGGGVHTNTRIRMGRVQRALLRL